MIEATIKYGATLDEMLAWGRNAIMDADMPSNEALAVMALAREVDRLRAEREHLRDLCDTGKVRP
ncbi:MAG TPA: hypothetical protein VMV44_05880 [Rectinemataceae bacterium]|nr:hypothetical protein [Rectinemataceae bacterium]